MLTHKVALTDQNVFLEMYVPLLNVAKRMVDNVLINQKIAMMEMHVPLMNVTTKLENALTAQEIASAQLVTFLLVTQLLDNVNTDHNVVKTLIVVLVEFVIFLSDAKMLLLLQSIK
jgi:hypothetical protein